jgi:hypothetical protein
MSTPQQAIVFCSTPICLLYCYRLQINMGLKKKIWYRLSNPRAMVRLEGLGKLKPFNDLIGNRTNDLVREDQTF